MIDPGPTSCPNTWRHPRPRQPLGRITTVLVTHRHGDHLPAAFPLCARDRGTARPPELPGVHQALDDDAPPLQLRALNTPGHTRDSVTFFDAPAAPVHRRPGRWHRHRRRRRHARRAGRLHRVARTSARAGAAHHLPRPRARRTMAAQVDEYIAHRRPRASRCSTLLRAARDRRRR